MEKTYNIMEKDKEIDITNIEDINIEDINIEDININDKNIKNNKKEKNLNRGEIYLIKNKENNKCYIGQASKYVSKNNNKWGTKGRWKSHLREALSGKKDHCTLLNQAIRKYSEKNFEVKKLISCDLKDIDKLE